MKWIILAVWALPALLGVVAFLVWAAMCYGQAGGFPMGDSFPDEPEEIPYSLEKAEETQL